MGRHLAVRRAARGCPPSRWRYLVRAGQAREVPARPHRSRTDHPFSSATPRSRPARAASLLRRVVSCWPRSSRAGTDSTSRSRLIVEHVRLNRHWRRRSPNTAIGAAFRRAALRDMGRQIRCSELPASKIRSRDSRSSAGAPRARPMSCPVRPASCGVQWASWTRDLAETSSWRVRRKQRGLGRRVEEVLQSRSPITISNASHTSHLHDQRSRQLIIRRRTAAVRFGIHGSAARGTWSTARGPKPSGAKAWEKSISAPVAAGIG